MANIHEIVIDGYASYDAYAPNTSQMPPDVMHWLATFNLPHYGFHIKWVAEPPELHLPNGYGGQTTFSPYRIYGQEAIWTAGIVEMIAAFNKIGLVVYAKAYDIENRSGWFDVLPHERVVLPNWRAALKILVEQATGKSVPTPLVRL